MKLFSDWELSNSREAKLKGLLYTVFYATWPWRHRILASAMLVGCSVPRWRPVIRSAQSKWLQQSNNSYYFAIWICEITWCSCQEYMEEISVIGVDSFLISEEIFTAECLPPEVPMFSLILSLIQAFTRTLSSRTSGKAGVPWDTFNVDWVPTLNLGLNKNTRRVNAAERRQSQQDCEMKKARDG